MSACQYCKGTGRIFLLLSHVPCECAEPAAEAAKEEPTEWTFDGGITVWRRGDLVYPLDDPRPYGRIVGIGACPLDRKSPVFFTDAVPGSCSSEVPPGSGDWLKVKAARKTPCR